MCYIILPNQVLVILVASHNNYVQNDILISFFIIIIKMNSRQGSISTISRKTGTPHFGVTDEAIQSPYFLTEEQIKTRYHEQEDREEPETIMELSSNSSDNQVTYKNLHGEAQESNTDIELVFVKQQQQLEKSKKNKGDKSRSDFNTGGSLTANIYHLNLDQKKSEKVTSSWGTPTCFEISRKKTVLDEKEAEEDCRLYKSGGWTRTKLMLTQNRLAFFQFSLDVKDLKKIKILPSCNSSKTKSENVIKIMYNDQVQLFSMSMDKKSYQIPTSYYIFAKLIEKRLFENGMFENASEWQKSEHVEKRATTDSYIYGNILKRSQVLGNWESRFVVVKKNGIYSYKNSMQEQNYSFHITSQSVKYIWTRFQMTNGYLIIKIKHGIFKTQFGIPLSRFSIRSSSNWLYSFYRTMPVVAPLNLSPEK